MKQKPQKQNHAGLKPLADPAAFDLSDSFYKRVARISAEFHPAKVFNLVIQGGIDLLGLDSGALALWNEERRCFVLRAARNMPAGFEGMTAGPEEGIIGKVFQTGETVVDERPPPFGPEKFKKQLYRAMIATPLRIGDRTLGVLILQTASPKKKISEQDRSVLEAWARQAGIAIRNALLFDANQRQLEQVEALQKSIKEIHSSLNPSTVLKRVLRQAMKRSQAESVWIFLWNEEEGSLTVRAVMNAPDAMIGRKLKLGEDLPGRAAQERNTLTANADDAHESLLFSGAPAGLLGTLAAVPLIRRKKLIGVLCLGAKEPDQKNPKEVQEEVEFLARHAAIAIFNADAFHSLERFSGELEQKVEGATQESNALREQMARREKLAALGQIVGSVNHELRQPLEVIANAVYYLKMQLERNDIGPLKKDFERFLKIISDECVNTTDLVNDLLYFTRKKEVIPLGVDLNKLLESILLKIQVPNKIKIKTRFDPNLSMIFADPVQLSRAFYNILTNGVQAMPKGGILRVSTEGSGGSVGVAIRDSGVGISLENLKKIFEPLFTTKTKGTGLGLSLVKEYIVANQGHIEVQSKEGAGTTFRISFPSIPAAEVQPQ